MNVARGLERSAHFFPERVALVFEGEAISYARLDDAAGRFAAFLRSRGVGKGDRVALFLPNVPAFAIAYLGIEKLGAIAVSLNVMLKRDEVKFILDDSGSRALVTTEELRPNVPRDELRGLGLVVIAEGEPGEGDASLAAIVDAPGERVRAVEMDRHDPAAILYTSGTTGFPKGATLSHGNVISNVHSTVYNCRMTPEDRLLLCLPLFHCFGQNFILNAALTAGATVVLERRFVPDRILDVSGREKVSMFFGVPAVFIGYLTSEIPVEAFDGVRYFFTAAAPMPAEVATTWRERFGRPIHEGYGLTETSPFASYNHPIRYKPGSIGTPIENVRMKIVDGDGQPVAPGELGEIAIEGPNVMLGYWGREEETRKAIRDGWFHSGDVGMADDEGYFFIRDRIKDMVITSGFNVYPVEIENVLYAHPAVAEAAVYGVPDSRRGEIVRAAIVPRPGTQLDEAEILAFCAERMASYKVPRGIEIVDAIPKNPSGKILKRVLRERAATPSSG